MSETKSNYIGIDYGQIGGSNRNTETGIHYGVISCHSLGEGINDIIADGADYGQPTCPKCQKQADEPSAFGESFTNMRDLPEGYTDETYESWDYVCVDCQHFFGGESAFSTEMLGWNYEGEGYKLQDCLTNEVFVIESPYYTYAQFCSPCVPGAGNLDNPLYVDTDASEIQAVTTAHLVPKVYCLGHEWFEGGKAPYRVFKVVDSSEVMPEVKEVE